MSRAHSVLAVTGIMGESLPRHGDKHRDMSGTGLLGRNFGDFSFHGLTAAFLCSF